MPVLTLIINIKVIIHVFKNFHEFQKKKEKKFQNYKKALFAIAN